MRERKKKGWNDPPAKVVALETADRVMGEQEKSTPNMNPNGWSSARW